MKQRPLLNKRTMKVSALKDNMNTEKVKEAKTDPYVFKTKAPITNPEEILKKAKKIMNPGG